MSIFKIINELQDSAAHFALIRQDIHRAPELGGDTPRTSALVAEMLGGWGYEVHTGIRRPRRGGRAEARRRRA